jgi:hypothetical protein
MHYKSARSLNADRRAKVLNHYATEGDYGTLIHKPVPKACYWLRRALEIAS